MDQNQIAILVVVVVIAIVVVAAIGYVSSRKRRSQKLREHFGHGRLRPVVRCGLGRLDHVAAARRLENFFPAFGPAAVIAVDRDEIAALADTPGITLRFHFWNAATN